jgi:hypothetical protein
MHEEGNWGNNATATLIKNNGWVVGQQSHGIP